MIEDIISGDLMRDEKIENTIMTLLPVWNIKSN